MDNQQRDRGNAIAAFGMMGVILLLILPLPAAVLDIMLALSISIALVVLVASLYVERPADFTVFPGAAAGDDAVSAGAQRGLDAPDPAQGNEGSGAAGDVIATFGTFVVGGNYVVGMIIFLILVIINFMVVTKGAGRIAEVAARHLGRHARKADGDRRRPRRRHDRRDRGAQTARGGGARS